MNAVIEYLNTAGSWFIAFSLPMLIQSSVLILVILGIDLLIRKKVRAVFRYGLWMLVLVKLMLPTSLSSPTGLGYWLGIPMPELGHLNEISTEPAEGPMALLTGEPQEIIYQELEEPILFPSEAEIMNYETPPVDPLVNESEQAASATATSTPTPTEPIPDITWQGIVLLAWLVIVLILFLLLLQRVFFVRGLVSQAQDAKGAVISVLHQCREKMGIPKKIPIRLSSNTTSPSVCGLWKPVILFPYGLLQQLNCRELESVLLHELAHIKRRDLWVNLVQTILQILYFFHPLFWLANALIRRVREQAVDEAVLATMDQEAEDYSNTLVRIFRMSLQRPALSLRLIGVVESKKSLATRIKHMLSRPLPKSAKLGILGILTVFLLGAILLPMAEARRVQTESQTGVSGENTESDEGSESDASVEGTGTGNTVLAEYEFGSAIEGVQCRLEPKRIAWHVREAPQFLVFPRVVDDNADLLLSNGILFGCQVEVDGKWYDYWSTQSFIGQAYLSCQELQKRRYSLDLTLTPHHYHSVKEKRALVLPAGKHTVRFAWAAYRSDYKTNPPEERPPLQVISNPVEIEIIPMENDFLQQQGGKYFHEAQTSAQGSPKNPEYTIECIRKALQYPQSDVNRAQLYIYWGDMIQIQTPNYRPEVWAPQRKKAAEIYLEGLHEVLKHNLPENPPDLPVVERFTIDGPPEIVERYRKINELQVQLRTETMRIRKLIQLRQILTGQLVQMYAREPDAFDELNELAVRYLLSEQAAKQIVAAARDYRKDSKTPFPAIVLEPSRDYQFWGEPVDGVQCRVRAEKSAWPQGSLPKLFADLRNRGQQNLRIALESESWELEIDGQWHKPGAFFSGRRRYLPLSPGQQQQNLEVWLPAVDNLAQQLQLLKPGKHTLRIARLFNDPWRPGNEVLRVVSNPIQIQILSDKPVLPEKVYLKDLPDLLAQAPVSTKYEELDIFEKVPEFGGEYRICPDVIRKRFPAKNANPLAPTGETFYIPKKNVFYVQFDSPLSSTLHYYGPFTGNPDEIEIIVPSITGRVFGTDGRPAIGYRVTALPQKWMASWGEMPTTLTDKQGGFSFYDLPDGPCDVSVTSNPKTNQPNMRIEDIPVKKGEPIQVRLSLEQKYRFGGRVTDAAGKPQPDRSVLAIWTDPAGKARYSSNTKTDPDGRYGFVVPFRQAQRILLNDSSMREPEHSNVEGNRDDLNFHLKGNMDENSKDRSAWGEAVEGVQVRLHSNKKIWNQGDDPSFKVDIRNAGSREMKTSLLASLALEIDGKSYTPEIWRSLTAIRVLPFGPGKQYSIDIKLSQFAAGRKGAKAVDLAPGLHTIKAVYLDNVSDDGRSHYASLNRAIASSNPVEIEVLHSVPDKVSWGKAVEGVQVGAWVEKKKWRIGGEVLCVHVEVCIADLKKFEESGLSTKLVDRYPFKFQIDDGIPLEDRTRHNTIRTGMQAPLRSPFKTVLYLDDYVWEGREPSFLKNPGRHKIQIYFVGLGPSIPSGSVEIEMAPEDKKLESWPYPWGKAVAGVQVSAHPVKPVWPVGSEPVIRVRLRNQGIAPLPSIHLWPSSFALEVDGKRYENNFIFHAWPRPFGPGIEYEYDLKLGKSRPFHDGLRKGNTWPPVGKSPPLLPGKHTVRVMFTELRIQPEPASQIGEFEIQSVREDDVTWGKPVEGVQVGAWVEKEKWRIGGEVPRIDVEVRISDTEEFQTCGLNTRRMSHDNTSFILEVDGRQFKDKAMYTTRPVPLQSPFEHVLYLDDGWEGTEPLQLKAGRHTIRVLFIGLGKTRAVGPIEIEVLPEDKKLKPWPHPWGNTVKGVQVSAQPAKPSWSVGSEPVIKVRLRNLVENKRSIHLRPSSFALEVDGKRYENNFVFHAWRRPFDVEDEYEFDLKLSKDRPFHDGLRKGNTWPPVGKSPPLLPGKHTVRVMFTELRIQPEPASNPVEIEILPAEKPAVLVEGESGRGKEVNDVQVRNVTLPDARDHDIETLRVDIPVALDLITGKLFQWEQMPRDWNHWLQIVRQGKGDLQFAEFEGRICLDIFHGGKVSVWDNNKQQFNSSGFSDGTDGVCESFRLPKIPCRLLLTTGNGKKFDVLILKRNKQGGLALEYKPFIGPAEDKSLRAQPKGSEPFVSSLRRDLEYAEQVPWGNANNGLQIRLIIPKKEGDSLPVITPNYLNARLEVRNVSDRPIKMAEQNTTGGRMNIMYDWLIGLTIGVTQPRHGARQFFRADDQDGYWSRIGSMPSVTNIEPGKKAVFKIQLRRLVDYNGTNLLSLRGRCDLRPVLRVRDDKFGLWDGTAVGKYVSVMINEELEGSDNFNPRSEEKPAEKVEGEGKRISTVEGQVLGSDGKPVKNARIVLGGISTINFSGRPVSKIRTDENGQFTITDIDERATHLLVWTDRLDMWQAPLPEPGNKLQINLPEPATLTIRYDMEGADNEGTFRLELETWKMQGWKGLDRSGVRKVNIVNVRNKGEITLTGLTPGLYDLARTKSLLGHGLGKEFCCDRKLGFALDAGSTTVVDFIRKEGFPIAGSLSGLPASRLKGAFVYVKSAEATGDPMWQFVDNAEWKLPTFDAVTTDTEGRFQTAPLPPGRYTVIAESYEALDNMKSGGLAWQLPDFIGTAKVSIPKDRKPPFVRIEMSSYQTFKPKSVPKPDVHVEVETPDEKDQIVWGEAVEGVQMRLHTEKKQWPAKTLPKLLVDIRNTGGNGFKQLVMYTDCWELELDGQWYRTTIEPWGRAGVLPFGPDTEHTDITVPLWDHLGWKSKDGDKPLQFLPGRHTIRVAFCMSGMQKSETNVYIRRGSEKWKKRVVSRPIEIEILSAREEEVSWSEGRDGVQVRLHSKKKIWNQGDDPGFKVDFRNNGTRQLNTSLIASLALEIDGKPYAPRAWWQLGTIGVLPFGPGKEYSLDIKLSQFAADGKNANDLTPGLHTIKAVLLNNNSARGLTTSLSRYKEMALACSDPVEISIILAEHKWSAPVNGLRAAVEFSPEKASYTQGQSVAVRFHIQNVSDSDIEFKSVSTRQDYAQVKDKDGKEVKVQRRFHSGTVSTRSHTIKPTDVLVLKTTGLGFAELEDQTLDDFKSKKDYYVGSILRSEPGTYAIHYNVNRELKTGVRNVSIVEKPQIAAKQITMKEVVQILARKYRVRLCFEDIIENDIADIALKPYRLTGNFKAQTIPPLLDQITQSGPFTWVKYNHTYVVYPRKNSLLEFPASLNIDDSPLEFVARKVLDKIPAGKEIEIRMDSDDSKPNTYKRGNVRHLWISGSPVRYALARAAEESGRGDTEIVWIFTKEQGRCQLTFYCLKTSIAITESGETIIVGPEDTEVVATMIVEKPRIENNQVGRTNAKSRNVREKRAANSSEGFISYGKLVQGLSEGEDRSKLAEGFQTFVDKYPEAYDSNDAKELSILLTQMAREDEKFVKPDDVNALPEEQRIAYYVFKLRDVAEQNTFDPGNCNVLMCSRTPQSSAIALRKIGKPAVPVLIGLLDDRRPTRSHNTGFSGHHVVRYCDAALQILDVISGQRFTHFDNRDVLGGTGAFLSNAKPHDRNRITSRIKKWWEQNQRKSESEWIRDVLSRSRISMEWDRIEIARRLIELEGPDSAPFFRLQLKKEPNNAWVLTLLLEAAGKAALEDIRPMIRHRDFAMRKTAYKALVEAGEMEVIDKVVDELNLMLKKIDSESNAGKDHDDNLLNSYQDRVGSLAYILILSNRKEDVLTAARLIQHKDSRIADRVLFLFHTLLEQKDKPSGESRRAVVPYMASVLGNKELRGWATGWLINALDLPFEFVSVSYDAAPEHEAVKQYQEMVKQHQEVYKQLEKWWNLHRHEYPSAR